MIDEADTRETKTHGEEISTESFKRAWQIHDEVASEQAGKGALRSDFYYLEKLAADSSSSPGDVLLLGRLMQDFPQIDVETKVEMEERELPLPIEWVLRRHQERLRIVGKIAQANGIDVGRTGKELRGKALKVARELGMVQQNGSMELKAFEALQRRGGYIPDQRKTDFWWGKVIPNVVFGKSLETIACRRQPSLSGANLGD